MFVSFSNVLFRPTKAPEVCLKNGGKAAVCLTQSIAPFLFPHWHTVPITTVNWNCRLLFICVVLQFTCSHCSALRLASKGIHKTQWVIINTLLETNLAWCSWYQAKAMINVWYQSCRSVWNICDRWTYLFQPRYYTVIVKQMITWQLSNSLLNAVVFFAHRTL